jgi:hypothetical protein
VRPINAKQCLHILGKNTSLPVGLNHERKDVGR